MSDPRSEPSASSAARPDPSKIMQLATGYWDSATLLAANELNLFGALTGEAKTAPSVATALNAALRATTMLLDACAGLGLVVKTAGEGNAALYANAPETEAFLVPGRPGYLGGAIRWGADQYGAWGELAASVRSDRPSVPPSLHLGDDPEQTRTFVLGMHNRALGVARGVIHFLDLAGATSLLDVGGGPGTYATLMAQKYPGLQATVLDLPGIVAVAQELIATAGLTDRVQTRAGNGLTDDYGTEAFDAVLFSGVLHQMAPATIQAMFAKAHRALKPGGRVLVSDVMTDRTKTQPAFATLFSLQMLLTSAEGAVFSGDECAQWLQGAGFEAVGIQRLPPPLPYMVVTAKKPA